MTTNTENRLERLADAERIPATNCKPGSAWHVWQQAGIVWRLNNPTEPVDPASEQFAADTYLPEIGQSAAARAFREGANLATR